MSNCYGVVVVRVLEVVASPACQPTGRVQLVHTGASACKVHLIHAKDNK